MKAPLSLFPPFLNLQNVVSNDSSQSDTIYPSGFDRSPATKSIIGGIKKLNMPSHCLHVFCVLGKWNRKYSQAASQLHISEILGSKTILHIIIASSSMLQLPDRPFHKFRGSESADRWFRTTQSVLISGFWGSETVKRSVGWSGAS